MAYRDPYTEQYGRYDQHYSDTPEYNPYNNTQSHPAYDQGGYDPYTTRYRDDAPNPEEPSTEHQKTETTQYNQGAFAEGANGNRRTRDLRHWRYEHHRGLWTKGSRLACIGRFCCCILMIVVFLIVSIIIPLILWARPPNIVVGSVQANTSNGSEIQLISDGVQLNLEIPIYVSNPNYFSVSFSSIKANIYYPINNTLIGGGEEKDVTFHAHSTKNLTFPFSIAYTTTMSSSAEIIDDLVSKCGITGGTASDITVDYTITLGLRIIFFTISPAIHNSASFACPLTASDLGSLTSALSGSGGL